MRSEAFLDAVSSATTKIDGARTTCSLRDLVLSWSIKVNKVDRIAVTHFYL